MLLTRKFLPLIIILLSTIFSANLHAQENNKLDSLRGCFNFRFGAPKEKYTAYFKPQARGDKYYVIDTSLDKRYRRVFNGEVDEIQVFFNENDQLNKIFIHFDHVPVDEKERADKAYSGILNRLNRMFGKYTDELNGIDAGAKIWENDKVKLAFVVEKRTAGHSFYTYQVSIQSKG